MLKHSRNHGLVVQNFTTGKIVNFTKSLWLIDNGTTDNCELVSVSLDITDLDCNHVGEITVTLTGTDASGNSGSATAVVTVLDQTPPTMACPDDIVTNNCATPAPPIMPSSGVSTTKYWARGSW